MYTPNSSSVPIVAPKSRSTSASRRSGSTGAVKACLLFFFVPCASLPCSGLPPQRDTKLHFGAPVGTIVDLELSAVRGGDGVDDREAEAGAVLVGGAAYETAGGVPEQLGREAGPVVAYSDDRLVADRGHCHIHAPIGVPGGVLDEVEHRPFDGVLVTANLCRARHLHRNRVAVAGTGDRLGGALRQRAQLDRLLPGRAGRTGAGEDEQVHGEAGGAGGPPRRRGGGPGEAPAPP